MTPLPFSLERTVLIRARRATVFHTFLDRDRFAAWWGPGSTFDPRPDGEVSIRYPNGVRASGRVLEIEPDSRVVFTFGYEAPDRPIPPGGSRVTMLLQDDPGGTRVQLRHELADEPTRDQHLPGWRYQLGLLANAAARVEHASLAQRMATWFSAWSEPDARLRLQQLTTVTTETITFRDAFGCVAGRDDLSDHIGAVQMHMPGLTLSLRPEIHQCQGTALVPWQAVGADGREQARGTNVVELAPDGRLAAVVGFWGA